jgi:hypothetical protein
MLSKTEKIITSTIVIELDRKDILPKYFKEKFLKMELLIYKYMYKLDSLYSGGYWEFFELSNSGFFMAPTNGKDKIQISSETNYFEGEMSETEAGIVACLFAFNQIASKYECERTANLYFKLLYYSRIHEENAIIALAID